MEPEYAKTKLNIAFFGTSDRSVPILNILKENYNLVLCVTKNDVKVGRHFEIKETEVKKWAKLNNVKVLSIPSMKGSEIVALLEPMRRLFFLTDQEVNTKEIF